MKGWHTGHFMPRMLITASDCSILTSKDNLIFHLRPILSLFNSIFFHHRIYLLSKSLSFLDIPRAINMDSTLLWPVSTCVVFNT